MNGNSEEPKKILECIKGRPEGLTIQDLSKILGLHRQTVAKYILALEAGRDIFVRRIGAVALCYSKKDWERLKK